MHIFDREAVGQNLGWAPLIRALEEMFAAGCKAPVRHHHTMEVPGAPEGTMLLMPAWIPGKFAGLKSITVFPGNREKGLPTIQGSYLLMDGTTGETLAAMDAGELTARRTAAASALASSYLSRKESRKLLIVGSGRLSGYLGFAHAAVRPIEEIVIWARNMVKAQDVAQTYTEEGFRVRVVEQLEEGVREADIISCATMAREPLVLGSWLTPGTHLDLIGGFTPEMRESDDEAVIRSRVFVDTREGALAEAGDLLLPKRNNVFDDDDIVADLAELAALKKQGRKNEEEITLFKSVGAALEDLAAAMECYTQWQKKT